MPLCQCQKHLDPLPFSTNCSKRSFLLLLIFLKNHSLNKYFPRDHGPYKIVSNAFGDRIKGRHRGDRKERENETEVCSLTSSRVLLRVVWLPGLCVFMDLPLVSHLTQFSLTVIHDRDHQFKRYLTVLRMPVWWAESCFWLCLWRCYQNRLAFESVDWVKIRFTNEGGRHPKL